MALNVSIADSHSQSQKSKTTIRTKIKVIGIGGAGSNAVDSMIRSNMEGVEFVSCNTDQQTLENSLAETKLQIGTETTKGLGTGSNPKAGEQAAKEAIEEIQDMLSGTQMLFLTAGMGGGTGTGAIPAIAKIAREMGILTVAVVTKPFAFEGDRRLKAANLGIRNLGKYVDTLIVINNQNLFNIADEQTTFNDAFHMTNEVVASGIKGVTDLMTMPGIINLDFSDIMTIMAERGKALIGTAEEEGEDRAMRAAERALNNQLLDDVSLEQATGVLVNVMGGDDLGLLEVDKAVNMIKQAASPNAQLIFGASSSQKLQGRIRITILATGIAYGDLKIDETEVEEELTDNDAVTISQPKQPAKEEIVAQQAPQKPSLVQPQPQQQPQSHPQQQPQSSPQQQPQSHPASDDALQNDSQPVQQVAFAQNHQQAMPQQVAGQQQNFQQAIPQQIVTQQAVTQQAVTQQAVHEQNSVQQPVTQYASNLPPIHEMVISDDPIHVADMLAHQQQNAQHNVQQNAGQANLQTTNGQAQDINGQPADIRTDNLNSEANEKLRIEQLRAKIQFANHGKSQMPVDNHRPEDMENVAQTLHDISANIEEEILQNLTEQLAVQNIPMPAQHQLQNPTQAQPQQVPQQQAQVQQAQQPQAQSANLSNQQPQQAPQQQPQAQQAQPQTQQPQQQVTPQVNAPANDAENIQAVEHEEEDMQDDAPAYGRNDDDEPLSEEDAFEEELTGNDDISNADDDDDDIEDEYIAEYEEDDDDLRAEESVQQPAEQPAPQQGKIKIKRGEGETPQANRSKIPFKGKGKHKQSAKPQPNKKQEFSNEADEDSMSLPFDENVPDDLVAEEASKSATLLGRNSLDIPAFLRRQAN